MLLALAALCGERPIRAKNVHDRLRPSVYVNLRSKGSRECDSENFLGSYLLGGN